MRLAWLLAFTMLLAGCSQDPGEPASGGPDLGAGGGNETADQDDSTDDTSDVDNETADGNDTAEDNLTNTPPVANLTADVLSGEAPLSVTFTITGTDADGDALAWSFDADGDGVPEGNGTTLPDTFAFTFEAGLYTASLTVSDGEANATASLEITATGASGPVQEESVGYAAGLLDIGAVFEIAACGSGPLEGVAYARIAIDEASHGLPFTATITDATSGAGVVDWGVLFFAHGCLAFDAFDVEGTADITGEVPADAAYAVFISTGGAEVEVDYVAG